MTKKEKIEKIQELSSIIVDLKKNRTVGSKKTIQKLQQEMDNLLTCN